MQCIKCGTDFVQYNKRQVRCVACQKEYNAEHRRQLMKDLNDSKRDRSILEMPDGYITLKDWSLKNGKSPNRGQKLLADQPSLIPAARKVRNPRGGVDIWVVPKDTIWPY